MNEILVLKKTLNILDARQLIINRNPESFREQRNAKFFAFFLRA